MKKVLIMILVIFLLQGVVAKSGVSPSKYTIDFEPGFEGDFKFRFIFDEDVKSEISLLGDLKEYASLDKKSIRGEEEVTVHLELPEKLENPGVNTLRVGARGILTGSESSFALGADVGGLVNVVVPYPGKYIETSLKSTRANAGENISLEFIIQSKGDEVVAANPYIEIRDKDNLIETIELKKVVLEKAEQKKYNVFLNTNDYSAGDYFAKGVVVYDGKVAESEAVIRLGHLFVDIINYTRSVSKDKIVRYGVDIESFWNDDIEDVFATGRISGTDIYFKTPSVDLDGWEKTHLNGFFDTEGLEGDSAKVVLTLYYGENITQKVVRVKLVNEIDWLFVLVVALLIIIILSLVVGVIYLWRKKKK